MNYGKIHQKKKKKTHTGKKEALPSQVFLHHSFHNSEGSPQKISETRTLGPKTNTGLGV